MLKYNIKELKNESKEGKKELLKIFNEFSLKEKFYIIKWTILEYRHAKKKKLKNNFSTLKSSFFWNIADVNGNFNFYDSIFYPIPKKLKRSYIYAKNNFERYTTGERQNAPKHAKAYAGAYYTATTINIKRFLETFYNMQDEDANYILNNIYYN